MSEKDNSTCTSIQGVNDTIVLAGAVCAFTAGKVRVNGKRSSEHNHQTEEDNKQALLDCKPKGGRKKLFYF